MRILAAVDPTSQLSDPRLAGVVLDAGLQLADECGGELHVLHAWSAHVNTLERCATPAVVNDYLRAAYEESERALRTLLDAFGSRIPADRVWLVRGDPVDAIAGVVDLQDVEVVVVGTSARRGVRGLLVGNTAERLVERVRCDVVVVKVPDFRSPLGASVPRARVLRGGG